MSLFPTTQGELIRLARGNRSQAEFARLLGCDRSCLSRYESGALGAPPHVIDAALQIVGGLLRGVEDLSLFDRALGHLQSAVDELQRLKAVGQRVAGTK